jgi:hypothetical protein
MPKGVETMCHNLYAQFTEIILLSLIFAANDNGGMAVIATKASQDFENLKDAFNARISCNNNAGARISAVLKYRQEAENALAVRLKGQRMKIEVNKLNAHRAMAKIQNTQLMEMEDNERKAEDDLRKQRVELTSTTREMKPNKK